MAVYDLASSTPDVSVLRTGDIINCSYCGVGKSVTLPKGTFKLECWGAEGGGSRISGNTNSGPGGLGGYAYGTLTLDVNKIMFLYTGGYGLSADTGNAAGGFNGGGQGYGSSNGEPGNGGGGGSDIRIGSDSLYSRIIVAGGGGGGGEDPTDPVGGGGGLTGVDILGTNSNGVQTAAGTGGGFGYGGGTNMGDGGGGGGGWYGGGTTSTPTVGTDTQGGGGGSGYIFTSGSYGSYPSGCTIDTKYFLTDASTAAANTSFVGPSGSGETGHQGHGYTRITMLSIGTGLNLNCKVGGAWKTSDTAFVKVGGAWKLAEKVFVKVNGVWVSQ